MSLSSGKRPGPWSVGLHYIEAPAGAADPLDRPRSGTGYATPDEQLPARAHWSTSAPLHRTAMPTMNREVLRVFLVDDDEDDFLLTRHHLGQVEGRQYQLDWAATFEAGLEELVRGAHDVYLVDYRLGPRDGLELIREAVRAGCRAPLILLTGQGDRAVDLEAMQAGAADFIVKGANAVQLERSIRYAIEHRRTQEALRRLHDELESRVEQRTAQLAEANRALQAEIAERVLAEEKLTASLREKEVLLREIHHRVKNNLQLITSLLKLQGRHLDDPRAQAALRDSQDRVRSLALIHEKLYGSRNLAAIDFADYVPSLALRLCQALGAAPEAVAWRVNVGEVRLRIDSAIPCALLVHELLVQALKRIAPLGRGAIAVEMYPEGDRRYLLRVHDDAADAAPPDAVGLQLIESLVDQLDGELEIHEAGGMTRIVRLTDVHYTERG